MASTKLPPLRAALCCAALLFASSAFAQSHGNGGGRGFDGVYDDALHDDFPPAQYRPAAAPNRAAEPAVQPGFAAEALPQTPDAEERDNDLWPRERRDAMFPRAAQAPSAPAHVPSGIARLSGAAERQPANERSSAGNYRPADDYPAHDEYRAAHAAHAEPANAAEYAEEDDDSYYRQPYEPSEPRYLNLPDVGAMQPAQVDAADDAYDDAYGGTSGDYSPEPPVRSAMEKTAAAQYEIEPHRAESPRVDGTEHASLTQPAALPAAGETAPLPLARRGASDGDSRGSAASAVSPSLQRPVTTMLGALAVVLGLFLLLVWFLRRKMPKSFSQLPGEVFEVIGRAPLSNKQQLHLVRLGSKLLLIDGTAGNMETLAEVADPHEVDRILAACRRHSPGSVTANFREMMQELEREPVRGGFAGT